MAHKGCLSVTKYFLFLFNLFFFILGSLLFGFGLWILFDRSSFASTLGSSVFALKIWSYIFAGVGILTMLLGFLGCLGSLKEIKCMLGFYFAFLFLLFVAQVTIVIVVYTQRETIQATVRDCAGDIIQNYKLNGSLTDREESWDVIQEQFRCCGWNSYTDWEGNQAVAANGSSFYPCSCRDTSQAGQPLANNTETPKSPERTKGFCVSQGEWPVYKEGCMASIQNWLANNIITIVGLCLGIALIELFLMTLSMFLCKTIGPNYDKLARYS
ncbi:leukocyte antigen CD37 [Sphaerodactylus townsendi]|uniref:leukocyte antigen CD37 n=1 Tax=Sphaerodactylus townsendi TaxID=933632 RepID=UPI002027362B|nr:leukocyte antigen CD37 [Sphaerodactylus townsendi]